LTGKRGRRRSWLDIENGVVMRPRNFDEQEDDAEPRAVA
jgi:hypothetical protein